MYIYYIYIVDDGDEEERNRDAMRLDDWPKTNSLMYFLFILLFHRNELCIALNCAIVIKLTIFLYFINNIIVTI